MGLHHAAITVKDMERSLTFYRDILGLKVFVDTVVSGPDIDQSVMESGAEIRMVMLGDRTRAGSLELLEWSSPACRVRTSDKLKYPLTGLVEICLEVPDLDELEQQLKRKGLNFRYPPFVLDVPQARQKMKITHLTDPDGVPVELIQTIRS